MPNDKKQIVERGDTVAVFYTGTLDDGSIFDSNVNGEPLRFIVGAGQMISGFEKGVEGMALGEEKDVHIPSSEAYGEKRKELIMDIPRKNFGTAQVKVGMGVQSDNGHQGVVMSVDENSVKVDFNPQLAGKDLNFRIKIAKIDKK
jgi:peptidylprolyl isomerase